MWYAVGAVAVVFFVLWFLGNYNGFVRLRQHILESWNNIDIELKRRHDLIPNLVTVVKGYAAHEREVLETVTQARAAAQAHQGDAEFEQPLVAGLRRLIALAEDYPELKADDHYRELQGELVETEDRIAAARRFYNANVRDYNGRRESVPSNLVAAFFGFPPMRFWEVEEATARAE